MNLQAINKFHNTRPGHLLFGLVELALAYWLIMLALDSGNLWEYLLVLVLFVGFLQNTFRLAINLSRVTKH